MRSINSSRYDLLKAYDPPIKLVLGISTDTIKAFPEILALTGLLYEQLGNRIGSAQSIEIARAWMKTCDSISHLSYF